MVGKPTPLQLFWCAQTFLAGSSTVYLLLKRSHWVKLALPSGDLSPGFFRFRKRLGMIKSEGSMPRRKYCGGTDTLNGYFNDLFTWATTPKQTNSDFAPTLLALFLFVGHLGRRLYESWGISVFSRRQLLGPIEFIRVYAFYIGAGLTIIAEAPPLTGVASCASLDGLGLRHLLILPIFYFSSRLHHDTHIALAKLRRNKAGHIVTTDHKMPKGGWFDVMSSPHYFAELLVYTSIGLILGTSNVTYWWMVTYVFTNQFYLAYNTHKYYEGKFENYPKERNMFIPYLL
ncbi:hypothetical protein CAPTEDRAFT_229012 [Capitella teleta]|uniref:Polyprenal reductase n=1 Tax=Capitella teleta TaxID=283909 RepID=R7UHU5_CAPTE|nr:hypothetical protein CAPTEDRAFT_229012 [Capitella teleta]|eukprot:ELU05653.1 hypothetical protein CAPTEDRAFT_229012 [Capitella teleta]